MDKRKDLVFKYKVFYKTLNTIECNALGKEKIYFNNKGFNHLIRKGRFPRSYEEQKYRLSLLKFLNDVITKGILIETRVVSKELSFWAIKYKDITVIVRQLGNKSKHFFSIFSK